MRKRTKWGSPITQTISFGLRSAGPNSVEQKGFSYSELEALGYILVVTDAHCHYRSSARYDETILIRTRLKEINRRMITFGYQLVKKGSEEVLAEGETRHLSIGPNGKPQSLPENFLNLLTS